MSRLTPRSDAGAALVEFTVLGVLLLVPLVYALTTVFLVQRAAFGVTEAARSAGRAFVTADTPADGQLRADEAVRLALGDQGIPDGTGARIDCSREGCLVPGSSVTVTVTYAVPLPLVGGLFGTVPASVPVTAVHVATVDRYRAEQ